MPDRQITYPPLDTPKPVADDVWIVDGPAIAFGPPGLKMDFPTRMTVIRLADGGLLLHSPTRVTPDLREEILALGTPRHLVGPNRIHYWWIPDWHDAFPEAAVWLAPRIREQAGARIAFDANTLDVRRGLPWDAEIGTLPVAGAWMTEVVLFHHASRTLVLTDLIENFEPEKISRPVRWLARFGGVLAPDGGMPRDMRLTFRRQGDALRRAIEEMISWQPERVIIAHGRWIERDGAAELERRFRWLLAP